MTSTPTLVLVHGAWHGTWAWERLREELPDLAVRMVALPSVGTDVVTLGDLKADAEAVRSTVAAIDGPVLVCAHSYGGVPATEGLAGLPNVIGLVYLCAFQLDIGESLAHEFAEGWLKAGRKRPSFADLAFRRTIDDPFDLAARPMLPSINTLTIRHDPIDGNRFYLHRRAATAVAAPGGMYHVVPAGAFQPAALAPAHQSNDFSLWRNVQREFSEEFLGNAEHDGNSIDPLAYETDEPFVTFERARQAGDFRVFACAVVLEPLSLWAEFLTVAVIAAPVFDDLFSTMVAVNEEGAAVSTEAGRPTTGIPFTAAARERLKDEPLSPISRACIELAWEHSKDILR